MMRLHPLKATTVEDAVKEVREWLEEYGFHKEDYGIEDATILELKQDIMPILQSRLI